MQQTNGGKKVCMEATLYVLVPELLELIAKFLPTCGDMSRLLSAIPTKYLTQALTTLKKMMHFKPPNDTHFDNKWSAVNVNRHLWPYLTLERAKKLDANVYEKIAPLYSAIVRRKATNDQPFKCRNVCLPPTHARIKECVNPFTASSLTLDLDDIFKQQDIVLPEQWKNAILSPTLQSLALESILANYLIHIVKTLKASNTLLELDMSDCLIGSTLLTSDLVQDLCFLSKRLQTLKLYLAAITPRFVDNFEGFPRQLINQKYSMLMFNYGALSGIRLYVEDIVGLAESLVGKNLVECDISGHNSEFTQLSTMLPLLKVLGQMQSLRRLKIDGHKLNLDCCEQMAAHIFPRLQACYLYMNDLDDDCGCVLARALQKCTRLELLSITCQNIADGTAIAFANSIAQGSPLRSLDLSCNNVGNEGILALSGVITRLDTLNLRRNQFNHKMHFHEQI